MILSGRFRGRPKYLLALATVIIALAATLCAPLAAGAFVPPGHISGQVTDWSDNPVPSQVMVWNPHTYELMATQPSLDGNFEFWLSWGDYVVGAVPYSDSYTKSYSSEGRTYLPYSSWFAVSEDTPDFSGQIIRVNNAPERSIVGTVTAMDGSAAAGAMVGGRFQDPISMEWMDTEPWATVIDWDGTFILDLDDPKQADVANFYVRFLSGDSPFDYDPQYYGGVFETEEYVVPEGATAVTVPPTGSTGITTQISRRGRITGNVMSGMGPAANVPVYAYTLDEYGEQVYSYSTETNADGDYMIRAVPSGQVKLEFAAYSETYLSEYWDGAEGTRDWEAAQAFTVSNDETVTAMNADLARAGSISGTVTASSGPTSCAVYLYQWREDGEGGWWNWETETNSSSEDGGWSFTGLDPTRPYRIRFNSGGAFTGEYYNNNYDGLYYCDTLTFGEGEYAITGILAELEDGASVSGLVTGGGVGIEDVNVTLYRWNASYGDWLADWETSTDATGNYTLGNLPVGDYRVQFDSSSPDYMGEWYNNAPSESEATSFTVAVGQNVTLDEVALPVASKLRGRVTDADGHSLPGIFARAYRWIPSEGGILSNSGYWAFMESAMSTESGGFVIGGLQPGTYRIHLEDPEAMYLDEWTDDVIEGSDGVPQQYDVLADETYETGNHDMDKGAVVTGAVSGQGLGPIGDVYVELFKRQDRYQTWDQWDTDYSVAPPEGEATGIAVALPVGTYQFTGLPAGTYRIKYSDENGRNLMTEYYQAPPATGSEYLAYASNVPLQTNSATSTIATVTLETGGRIRGSALRGTVPVEAVSVSASRWDDWWGYWRSGGYGSTDEAGAYEVQGLRTGTYRVGFQRGNLFEKYYANTYTFGSATGVGVTAGAIRTGINAQIPAGGSIVGTMTAGGAAPGENLFTCVTLFTRNADNSLNYITDTYPLADGTFVFNELQPGNYVVLYTCESYRWEYHTNASTPAAATLVAVTANGTTKLEADLTPGLTIAGTIRSAAGGPLSNVNVIAYDAAGDPVSGAQPEADGTYAIGRLYPGTYYVGAFQNSSSGPESLAAAVVPPLATHAPTFFGDKTNPLQSTKVTLLSGSVGSKDITMTAGAIITGTVTAAVTGDPIENAWVTAKPTDTWLDGKHDLTNAWTYLRESSTDANGDYTIYGLVPNAAYHVGAGGSGYASMMSDGSAYDFSGASKVSATGSANFALPKRSSIIGGVFEKAGANLRHTLDINVWYNNKNSGTWIRCNVSQYLDRDGRITFVEDSKLLPGQYKLTAHDYRTPAVGTPTYLATVFRPASPIFSVVASSTPANIGNWFILDSYPTATLETASSRFVHYPSTYWNTWYTSAHYGGSAKRSRYANAREYIQYNGTAIVIYGAKGPRNGKFKIYVDGKYKGTYSTYYSKTLYRRALYSATLAPGRHTVIIQSVSSAPVVLDRITVKGAFEQARR